MRDDRGCGISSADWMEGRSPGSRQIIMGPSCPPMDSGNSYRMKDIWRKARKKRDAARTARIVPDGVGATVTVFMTGKGRAWMVSEKDIEEEPETADWSSHDEFGSFMCRYLV